MTTSWQSIAAAVRARRDAGLAKVEPPLPPAPETLPRDPHELLTNALTPRELELTEKKSTAELLESLAARTLKAEELVRAFLRRAAVAQRGTNCLTEFLWDDAISRARWLDAQPAPVGPLHGLPVSIKDQHGLVLGGEHYDGGAMGPRRALACSAYMVACADDPSEENGVNLALEKAGAVFFVRTNGPQTIMHLESENNLFGRTNNAYHIGLTSGGSSGGEGALLGMRGSPLGMGADIGGSIRNPSALNGVYGFKPTVARLPFNGPRVPYRGRDCITGTQGPFALDRDTFPLFFSTVLGFKPWLKDPSLTPLPWIPFSFGTRRPRVGVLADDGVVRPVPPVRRALARVAEDCARAGMELVEWKPLDHARAWELISALYWPDGGKVVLDCFAQSGEPIHPLSEWIMKQPSVRNLDLGGLFELSAARDEYRKAYAAHWSATAVDGKDEVDFILAPATPGPAPPHGTTKYWGYTSQWNLLDYPAATFPVTVVDPAVDGPADAAEFEQGRYEPRNEADALVQSMYSGPEKYAGAPISLQIIGRRNYDEKVYAALEAVEQAMGRK